jgi:outer membrane protein assembly factor BamB
MRLPLCIFLASIAFCDDARCADPAVAGSPDDPVLGAWAGTEAFDGDSKPIALRFELYAKKNNALVAYYDNPRMKFKNLGPMPVTRSGNNYDNAYFHLALSADHAALDGRKSFDGHDLGVELRRGTLPAATDVAPVPIPAASPVWTFMTDGAIWSSPVAADATIYFGSNDGMIRALGARDGKLLWEYRTGAAVRGRPTIAGTFLYVPSDDGFLYKLKRADGSIVWKFDLHGAAVRDLPNNDTATYDYQTSAATVLDGAVYIGSADGHLYAIDADSGAQRWRFATQGSVRSTPAAASGRVFFGSYDHFVYALDAKNGTLAWKHDTLEPVVSAAAVDAGSVYIGSRSSDLFAFDAATGAVRWKFFYWASWVESAAVIRDHSLYIGSSDYQQVFAIDAASGKERWRFNTGGSPWPTPAVTDKRLYAGAVGITGYFIDHRGAFFSLDRASGKPVWQFALAPNEASPTWGVAASPVVDHGRVFFGGLDGTLYAFRAD